MWQGLSHIIWKLNDNIVSCSFVQVRNSDKILTGMNHYIYLCLTVINSKTTKISSWCNYKEHLLNIIEVYAFIISIRKSKNFTWKPCNVFVSIMTLGLKIVTF